MSQQINLLNPIFRKEKKIFSARTMVQALAVLAGAMVLFAGYAAWQVSGLARTVAEAEARLSSEEKQLGALAQALSGRKPDPRLAEEIAALEKRLAKQEALVALLSQREDAAAKPASAYLAALARATPQGVWITRFEVRGQALAIEGRTVDPELVPYYLRRLGAEPVFAGARFATFRLEQGESRSEGARRAAPWHEFALRSPGVDKEPL